jgi:hypothetical protein
MHSQTGLQAKTATARFVTLLARIGWTYSTARDTLMIHCGPADFDGWVERVTKEDWRPGDDWDEEEPCEDGYHALSIFPQGDYRAMEDQKIILCDIALPGPPNYQTPTIKELHEKDKLKAPGHIKYHAEDTVSQTLLHEMFHCTLKTDGEYED